MYDQDYAWKEYEGGEIPAYHVKKTEKMFKQEGLKWPPKKEIERHLQIALKEVGEVKPWFDKKVNAWVFEHKAYPVGYGGESKEEVIKNYPKYLREFIRQRLNDNLAPSVEKRTKGRGGKREGAGRPKGTKKELKKRIYLPTDITAWVNEHPSEAISFHPSIDCKGKKLRIDQIHSCRKSSRKRVSLPSSHNPLRTVPI